MKRIFVPTKSPVNWKNVRADTDLHWESVTAAMTLALSWEAAGADGFPVEVQTMLDASECVGLRKLTMLLAVPEYEVDLPGGQRPAQTDAMVVAKGYDGLVTIAVEGKVDEPFGPTVGEKRAKGSEAVNTRLEFLHKRLGLTEPAPDATSYQLLNRTACALLTAFDFEARLAVMLVHSFSSRNEKFDEFAEFVKLFGCEAAVGSLVQLRELGGIRLFAGWCKGDERLVEVGERARPQNR